MSAPWPPGSQTVTPTPQQMLGYLDELGAWIPQRRADLDRIDSKVQAASGATGIMDITTTMAVWQAINQRYADILRIWDSGRVTDQDLTKISTMIWSNLNDMLTPGTSLTTGAGLAVSLPEACRMLEALIAQLTTQFQLAQVPTEASARIQSLRAQLERIKEQSLLDPASVRTATDPQVKDLADDVADMLTKSDQGSDIGGLLGPLEIKAARLERDLIVGHAERAMLAQRIDQATARRDALIERENAISDLVSRTRAEVSPSPKYAVPHVRALGDVPSTAEAIDQYLAGLDKVSSALDQVQTANQNAAKAKDDLISRVAKIDAEKLTGDLAAQLSAQIHDLLTQRPTPLDVTLPLVKAYEALGGSS